MTLDLGQSTSISTFDRWSEAVRPLLSRYVQRRMNHRLRRFSSVDDLLQDTLIAAARRPDLFVEAPWEEALRRVRRLCRWTLQRSEQRIRRMCGESAIGKGGIGGVVGRRRDSSVTEQDLMRRVRRFVRTLPPLEADVVQLRAEGLSYREIGGRLGIQEAAARKRFGRALARLRGRLDDGLATRSPGDWASGAPEARA